MNKLGKVTSLVHPLHHSIEHHVSVVWPSGLREDWLLTGRDLTRARSNAEANRSLLPTCSVPKHSLLWIKLMKHIRGFL